VSTSKRRNIALWSLLFISFLLLAGSIVVLVKKGTRLSEPIPADDFAVSMLFGRIDFENGNANGAVANFSKAVAFGPTDPDAHLNLANALLLAGQSEKALAHGRESLQLSANSASALYVIGCAHLRLGQAEDALKALQQSHFIDPSVAAVSYQIGRAHQALNHWIEATSAFSEAIRLAPNHPSAHYALSQVLIRAGQPDAAQAALARHTEIAGRSPNVPRDPTFFEKCEHTVARLPKVNPELPSAVSVPIQFVDATVESLGTAAATVRGPIGVVDLKNDGNNSLIVMDSQSGFRVLVNQSGKFNPANVTVPAIAEAEWRHCTVGDLDNDGVEDAIFLSDRGTQVLRLQNDATLTDVSEASGLRGLVASDAALADLDFTGKPGLVAAGEKGISSFRNQGKIVFQDVTAGSGLGINATKAHQVTIDDWNNDDLPDLFVVRESGPPELWLNQHGGPMKLAGLSTAPLDPTTNVTEERAPSANLEWPFGLALEVADFNCDRRNDVVVATTAGFEIVLGGIGKGIAISGTDVAAARITAIDYDNDGWQDLIALSNGRLRSWRNLGSGNFVASHLFDHAGTQVHSFAHADFDRDGDTDLAVSTNDRGLLLIRNDGGNANYQVKLRLPGRRSNASGLGVRVELVAGGWRTMRTVRSLPVEIGVGKHTQLDSLSLHWSDVVTNRGKVDIATNSAIEVIEPELPAGSCPYLYVWNGNGYRYVTDLLGASPAGLRLTDDRFIEADTDEIVRIGNESSFQPRDGNYVIQITDELRELLFFDQVELLVVDRPADLEVHSTSKLRPGKPFVPHELWALGNPRSLNNATRTDGTDVTSALQQIDGIHVSPMKLRSPQLRGLAEPFGVTLEFGELPADRPLVLALTGWLRFGGGMANVAASHDPALPFPFPILEVETQNGQWERVDVVAGAPAGKTKSIMIDLTGKLPPNAKRLRLSTAFEIHWDRIALLERSDSANIRETRFVPTTADLHWRGTSEYEDLPWYLPLTPVYNKVRPMAPWLMTPAGWCTRYGDVRELVTEKDNALVILNCGDELTLTFPEELLPPKLPGHVREFFLFTSGWDKDADYHVRSGSTVEPIPWHGMDDQLYGQQPRPVIDGDWWVTKYNTRWVGPVSLRKSN
jgi:tetratricopeptide (TPR) repeat protein